MTETAAGDGDFFKAVMDLAASHGWRRASLSDIAGAAGLSLAGLQAKYSSKAAILSGFADHIDAKVLDGRSDDDGSARDRLFDVLMRRFDALNPYKDGLAVLVKEAGGDGLAGVICGGRRLMRSMAWMLESAGIGSAGLAGKLRTKGLAAVYGGTFMTWLRDDTEDMSRTMATLDRNLARAERFASMGPGRRRAADGDDAAGYPPQPGPAPAGPAGNPPGGGV